MAAQWARKQLSMRRCLIKTYSRAANLTAASYAAN